MEKTMPVMMFVLLVTVSSVLGMDFEFNKDAYLEIMRYREETLNNNYDYIVPTIHYYNMDDFQEWVVDRSRQKEKNEGKIQGTFFVPKDRKNPHIPGISVYKGDVIQRERLARWSMHFRTLSNQPDSTVFGTIVLTFTDDKNDPHETSFIVDLFSPAMAENDRIFAREVAVQSDPLTATNMKQIAKGKAFRWKLSYIGAAFSEIKRYFKANIPEDEKFTIYMLKPIIANRDLMFEYFKLSNPTGKVNKLAPVNEMASTSHSAQ